jgi:hypothetical protein
MLAFAIGFCIGFVAGVCCLFAFFMALDMEL